MFQEIICLNFQGNKGMCGTNDNGKCFSLNAMHGHDVHVVCFQQNQREEVRDMGMCAGAITAESGMHNTNYVVYPGIIITSANSGSNPQPGDPCPTLVNDSRYYLVGEREDDR